MTLNELIVELTEWQMMGYGEKPVYWMNLKIDEDVEIDDVSPLPNGNGLEIR